MATKRTKAAPAAKNAPVAAEAPGVGAGQAAPDTTTAVAAAAPQGAGSEGAPAPGPETELKAGAVGTIPEGADLVVLEANTQGKDEVEALFVRTKARSGSRRRAGFSFMPTPYGIALDALTEEQIAAIEGDPHLVVERATFPADEAGE